jgi:hypothetical protein
MTDQIHVLFSEEGEACAIRKWSKEPFYDAQTYVQKALLDTLAARVLELEAENKRLREANYKAFTDGMEAAAQICGSLAELEYDDADGFEAATGCEAAIMRVVKEQRTEQARAALKGGEI